MSGLIGKKIGMTSVYSAEGKNIPCTVIEAGPCVVTQIKTVETDSYAAVQIAYDEKSEKHTSNSLLGHFKKAGTTPKRKLAEFKGMPEVNLGDTLTVDLFTEEDWVDVTGISKGKGFQGVVKRHGFGGVGGQTNGCAALTACYATGNVIIEINPKKNIAGGSLVGMNAGISLLACYATGNVTSTGSSTGKVHIFGLLGDNYTTVTACYWNDSPDPGIGYDNGSGQATKVDGTDVTWADAVDAMNTALQSAGSEWRYELTGELPTLKK